ncbi:MAG TPA: anthranilate phosphoribosyltransferase [Candidatus Sulfotelmatobacter sp.]|jgi:anthranilate phosphoribosyltransferase|nr:anthranilate phosphoribosyltransferase [Candidatus Sulfotelmatobacter sp.]
MNSASNLLIEKAEASRTLSRAEAEAFMEELLSGCIATPEIVRMLLALNQRAVSVDELTGFAHVMRKHAAPVFTADEPRLTGLVDTCGTGGDETGTFNISTAAAIVAAAAGARVAKHGNRSVSSRSGSADVLESLGVRIDLPMTAAGRSVREIGIGFLFAPAAHAAARHAGPARQQIGKRTIFNLLGPLTNPAGAEAQVLGVFSADVIDTVAATLAELGTHHAFVVHGSGGLDEISLSGETQIAEVRNGSVRRFIVAPEDFGISRASLEVIRGGTPQENAKLIHSLLSGEPGPRLDIVIANAAAALVVTGMAEDFRTAAELARRAVASGKAREKLDRLKDFSQKHAANK